MEYNQEKLPERMDFHKATKDLPLPRDAKSKFQIQLGTMTKSQVKNTIKTLKEMMHNHLREAKIESKGEHIIIPKKLVEKERRELLQKAIFAKATYQFAEKYMASLEMQKMI